MPRYRYRREHSSWKLRLQLLENVIQKRRYFYLDKILRHCWSHSRIPSSRRESFGHRVHTICRPYEKTGRPVRRLRIPCGLLKQLLLLSSLRPSGRAILLDDEARTRSQETDGCLPPHQAYSGNYLSSLSSSKIDADPEWSKRIKGQSAVQKRGLATAGHRDHRDRLTLALTQPSLAHLCRWCACTKREMTINSANRLTMSRMLIAFTNRSRFVRFPSNSINFWYARYSHLYYTFDDRRIP